MASTLVGAPAREARFCDDGQGGDGGVETLHHGQCCTTKVGQIPVKTKTRGTTFERLTKVHNIYLGGVSKEGDLYRLPGFSRISSTIFRRAIFAGGTIHLQ